VVENNPPALLRYRIPQQQFIALLHFPLQKLLAMHSASKGLCQGRVLKGGKAGQGVYSFVGQIDDHFGHFGGHALFLLSC
jgi:hypothetical protein